MATARIIILLSPVYICLFFSILFLTVNPEKRSHKTIIGVFMAFAFFLNLSTFFYQNNHFLVASYFNGIFMASMLSMLPLFYLYILSLTDENFSLRKNSYHLLPSLLFFIIVTSLHLLLPEKEKVFYMSNHLTGDFSNNRIMKFVYGFHRMSKYVFCLQTIVYFILSTKNLLKHKSAINNMFSRPEGLQLNWLYIFSFIYFFASLNAIIINFISIKNLQNKDFILNISFILFAIFYFSYGLLAFRQKSVMQMIRTLDSSIENEGEQIDNPNELMSLINNYIIQNDAYLNPELKIWDIAKNVYSNRTYISNVINEKTGMNFSNYINSFRVKKACSYLSESGESYHVDDLVSLCGFNSTSSFNRAFRLHTGLTIGEYKKTCNKI